MSEGFVIMQIGNPELDDLYEHAIAPAIEEAGLRPRRVDKHNAGGLLKSEIIEFIQHAEVIVADLTNERPNCYLEVGFAMGADRTSRLILTARRDHLPDRPGREPSSPKIHFDLAGYDILFWDPDSLPDFKKNLAERIKRRLNLTSGKRIETVSTASHSGETNVFAKNHLRWIHEQQTNAQAQLSKDGYESFVEFKLVPIRHSLSLPLPKLLDSARSAQLSYHGFPIGMVFDHTEARPHPVSDGIQYQQISRSSREMFDYWALGRNGDFYALRSLVEDQSDSSVIYFDEAVRNAEMLLRYASELYKHLGLPKDDMVAIEMGYEGIANRVLSSYRPGRGLHREYRIREDLAHSKLVKEWNNISAHLPELVRDLAMPILEQFDLFPLGEEVVNSLLSS
jgi:hypothetical protein